MRRRLGNFGVIKAKMKISKWKPHRVYKICFDHLLDGCRSETFLRKKDGLRVLSVGHYCYSVSATVVVVVIVVVVVVVVVVVEREQSKIATN